MAGTVQIQTSRQVFVPALPGAWGSEQEEQQTSYLFHSTFGDGDEPRKQMNAKRAEE